ncbi:MAG: hypothetical protein MJ211_04250 [Bacteroidales bacterium]|nr:hypothetical protein [Bacteroidales bacterium]
MLPEFLLADNMELPDKFFVVHTSEPRFILQTDSEDFNKDQVFHWIDSKPSDDEVANLLKASEEFLNRELADIDSMED